MCVGGYVRVGLLACTCVCTTVQPLASDIPREQPEAVGDAECVSTDAVCICVHMRTRFCECVCVRLRCMLSSFCV